LGFRGNSFKRVGYADKAQQTFIVTHFLDNLLNVNEAQSNIFSKSIIMYFPVLHHLQSIYLVLSAF